MSKPIPSIITELQRARGRLEYSETRVRQLQLARQTPASIDAAKADQREAEVEVAKLEKELRKADFEIRKVIDKKLGDFIKVERLVEAEREATIADAIKRLPAGLFANEQRARAAIDLSILGAGDQLGLVRSMSLSWEIAEGGGRQLRQPTGNLPHVIEHVEERIADAYRHLEQIKTFRKQIKQKS